MTILHLAIAALATARITSLLVSDVLLEPVRHRVFLLSPPHDNPNKGYAYQQVPRPYRQGKRFKPLPRKPGFVGQLLSCTHCMGVWVAAGVYAVSTWAPTAVVFPVLTIAAIAQISEATIKASR